MAKDPEAGKPKIKRYPSDDFLKNAENFMLYRHCNFVLQSLLILARVFQAPKLLTNTYGEGFMTSARSALFMVRTFDQTHNAATQLKSMKRHLYARMLQDAETQDYAANVLKDEWNTDRLANFTGRVEEWLPQHLAENIGAEKYPRTNLTLDWEKQWDTVWEDPQLWRVVLYTSMQCFVAHLSVPSEVVLAYVL